MNNYRLDVISYSRRLILLLIIGVVVLFSTESAASQENLPPGKIAFSRQQIFIGQRPTSLLTVNADGSGLAGVVSTSPYHTRPAWSRDGLRIVYHFGSDLGTDVYTINADGTNLTNLTNTPGIFERNPSWSVKGKIAYERDSQIWTMSANGTKQLVFFAITQPVPVKPAWSPDASMLAFSTSGGDIWIINADGSNERRITTSSLIDTDPAWSPDGLRIAFTRNLSSFSGEIWVINVDGTNATRLTNSSFGGNDIRPSWSNDGTKITFARRSGGFNDGIYVMNADGTNQTVIVSCTSQIECVEPAWQPVQIVSSDRSVRK